MKVSGSRNRAAAIYISHGGGPLPILGDAGHLEMIDVLQKMATMIPPPSAIVVISAHWEEKTATITGGAVPPLIYDYYGFPSESYEITYPVPGNPQLARRILQLLEENSLAAQIDERRGFDHGLFIPLKIMYPQADIPCLQLSLLEGLDPARHLAMGAALRELRKDPILLVGSGFSFHNLRAFFSPPTAEGRSLNLSFEQWLADTCFDPHPTEEERQLRLCRWRHAPGAGYCHPREEHLLPLHVCCGFAAAPAKTFFSFEIMGKRTSAYLWECIM